MPVKVQKLIVAVCLRNKTGAPLPADDRQRIDKLLAPLIAEEKAAEEKAAAVKGKQLLEAATAGDVSAVAQLIKEGAPRDHRERVRA